MAKARHIHQFALGTAFIGTADGGGGGNDRPVGETIKPFLVFTATATDGSGTRVHRMFLPTTQSVLVNGAAKTASVNDGTGPVSQTPANSGMYTLPTPQNGTDQYWCHINSAAAQCIVCPDAVSPYGQNTLMSFPVFDISSDGNTHQYACGEMALYFKEQEVASGPFAISGLAFTNPVLSIGGKMVSMGQSVQPQTQTDQYTGTTIIKPGYHGVMINATTSTPAYSYSGSMPDTSASQYYLPLYKIDSNGLVEIDFRLMPSAQMFRQGSSELE